MCGSGCSAFDGPSGGGWADTTVPEVADSVVVRCHAGLHVRMGFENSSSLVIQCFHALMA